MRSLSILAAVATTALLSAQGANTAPRPAPQWVLNALQLSAGTVQDLQLPQARETFRFDVALGGTIHTIELEPVDIRSTDFQLLVDDGTTITRVPTPAPTTWRGQVVGVPTSAVGASIVDGRMEALVSLSQEQADWGIESLQTLDPDARTAEHVVYLETASTAQNTVCGVGNDELPVAGQAAGGIDNLEIAEIAIDCDLEWYQRNGSNVTRVQNAATALTNSVDVIYRRDVDIGYRITTILVRTSRTYNQSDLRQLLPEFRSRWNANHGNIRRDVATLYTGKGSFSGIIGIAYLGVICNLSNAYNVNKAFSNNTNNIGLVAHELGHNWNAPHCNSSNPCNIMCSGLGGCNRNLGSFAPVTQSTVLAFKQSRGCLEAGVSRPTLSNAAPNNVQVWPATTVTLNGNNLNGVTTVNIGGFSVSQVTVLSNTQLSFQSPVPTALGALNVTATNSAGTSNGIPLSFSETNPPGYGAPAFGFSNSTLDLFVAGAPNDDYFIIAAFNDNTTVPLLGYDVLLNNIVLVQGQLNAVGVDAIPYPIPAASLTGVTLFSQAALLDLANFQLNFVTSVASTQFFF